jgi:hypothetical protein
MTKSFSPARSALTMTLQALQAGFAVHVGDGIIPFHQIVIIQLN